MLVFTKPRVTLSKRSSSVGNVPWVLSGTEHGQGEVRGFANPRSGSNHIAFFPAASPLGPWHPMQYRHKVVTHVRAALAVAERFPRQTVNVTLHSIGCRMDVDVNLRKAFRWPRRKQEN